MRYGTKKWVGILALLALSVAACTSDLNRETTSTTDAGGVDRTTVEPQVLFASHALSSFDACDDFLDHVISHAVELVGPYGFDGPFWGPWTTDGRLFEEDAAGEAPTTTAPAQARDFSGTNVQVAGVDEPDMVKTDGDRIVLISEGSLIVVDVTGVEPREVGRLNLEGRAVQSFFLSGNRVLMFGAEWVSHPIPLAETDASFAPVHQSPTVQVTEVDISGDPEILRTMSIDGSFISGRMVGDAVRLVVTSGPVGFEWSYPKGAGLRAERKAIEENREIIRNSTEENWIPYYLITNAEGDVIDEGVLFDCDRARHPDEFSGLDMLSVVTIEFGSGFDLVDATGVLATGNTVYASADSLYVATQGWQAWQWGRGVGPDRPGDVKTEIHKFDISDLTTTEYLASGEVEGYLLNQFSMDEHEGLLRVASTTSPNWWGSGTDSESMVTILGEVDGELIQVGLVDGLGVTEQIYSVRFMGDIGYVVTFRQTDPLYTLDLSEPTDPEVVGELKILGYSAYLHPLGGGLLMGVGQDATDSGRIQGTQVSVFDVSDPSEPERVDTYTLSEGSNSQVEYDHHAFLYWEPDRLAMVPVQQWRWDDKGEEVFFGVLGIRVGSDGSLEEVETIVHPGGSGKDYDWRAQVQRSVVIEDIVYTISSKGMMKSSTDTLTELAWLDF